MFVSVKPQLRHRLPIKLKPPLDSSPRLRTLLRIWSYPHIQCKIQPCSPDSYSFLYCLYCPHMYVFIFYKTKIRTKVKILWPKWKYDYKEQVTLICWSAFQLFKYFSNISSLSFSLSFDSLIVSTKFWRGRLLPQRSPFHPYQYSTACLYQCSCFLKWSSFTSMPWSVRNVCGPSSARPRSRMVKMAGRWRRWTG